MATAYGGYYSGAGYNAFRAVMDYSISTSNETSATVSVVSKCQMGSGHDSGNNFTTTRNISGTSNTAGKNTSYFSAGGTYTIGSPFTKTITKTHSAQSISVKVTVASTYAWSGHSSTASATISIPAKSSYSISYNANNGSGAPSAQTAWHGETLTLSTTVPTRNGYNFLGWAESSTATTAAYQPGNGYTFTAAKTLYAVWKTAYKAPSISSLRVFRADQNNNASDTGTYCSVSCTWSVDTDLTAGNTGDKLIIAYKPTTSTTWIESTQAVTLSGNSGTTNTLIRNSSGSAINTFAEGTSYNVRVTVSDTSGQTGNTTSATLTLSSAFFTLDFGNQGHNIGIGHAADLDYGIDVGVKLRCDNVNFEILDSDIPPAGTDPSGNTTVWGNGLYMYPSIDVNETNQELAVGYIRAMHRGDGAWNPRARGIQIEAQRGTGTNRNTNALNLLIDNSGNRTVEITHPAAWRAALEETDWANLSLGSNAQSYSDSWVPKYKRHLGSLVTIRGAVKPKTQVDAGGELLIGTLPTGFRPSLQCNTICQGSGGSIFLLAVYEDGKVQCERYRNGSTNAAIPTTAWVSFSFTFAL